MAITVEFLSTPVKSGLPGKGSRLFKTISFEEQQFDNANEIDQIRGLAKSFKSPEPKLFPVFVQHFDSSRVQLQKFDQLRI